MVLSHQNKIRIPVVEYLGLPASGKSWHLSANGFCAKRNALPLAVSNGLDLQKAYNTFTGIFYNPALFLLFMRLSCSMRCKTRPFRFFRSVLVFFERYGRIKTMHTPEDCEIHVDEGCLHGLWRVFSRCEPSSRFLRYLERCFSLLPPQAHVTAFISCPKEQHLSQLLSRKKTTSPFDADVIKNSKSVYYLGRFWMAQVLKTARRSESRLFFIRTK